MLQFFFIFSVTHLDMACTHLFKELGETFFQKQLQNYSILSAKNSERTSCSYINLDLQCSMDVLTIFLQENNCPSIIVDESYIETDNDAIKSEETFIFINNITGVDETIDQIRSYTFWSSRSHNHFIICSSVDNNMEKPNH